MGDKKNNNKKNDIKAAPRFDNDQLGENASVELQDNYAQKGRRTTEKK